MTTIPDDTQRQTFWIGTRSHVLCLDRGTGEVVWRTDLPDAGFGAALTTLVVAGDRIYATCSRVVACLHAWDGRLLWHTRVKKLSEPASLALDPSTPEGRLLVASAGRIYALCAETGELTWQNDLPGLGLNPLCMRVPGAIVAQPVSRYVSTGQSVTIQRIEDDQVGGD